MVFDYLADINWLAVLVATVAYFAVGFVWYSNALFGKQYRAALGQEEGSAPAVSAIIINFIGWFVAAAALAWFFTAIGVDDLVDGILWGLIAAIGFIGTNRIVGQAYGGDNPKLMPINAPYTLIGYTVMGAILAVM